MKQLRLPEYSFRITGEEGSEMIFDPVRKKYVKLTDEEWVRQNFVQYLIREGNYPAGLIIIEAAIGLYRTKKRIDILVHDRHGKPVMIVECKSPAVEINDEVFEQIVTYNLQFRVPYIIVTNGIVNNVCKIDPLTKKYKHLNVIPLYEDLLT